MSEIGETPQVSEIGFRNYIEVVKDKGFVDALREAAELTRNSGREAMFRASITDKGGYRISRVSAGRTDSTEDVTYETAHAWTDIARPGLVGLEDDSIPLVHIHFHPTGDPRPSRVDLETTSVWNGLVDMDKLPRATSGIGVVDRDGNIDLLLYRIISEGVPTGLLLDDVDEDLSAIQNFDEDSLPSETKKDEIAFVLKAGFYNATVLSLVKDDTEWSVAEDEKIRQFFR